MPLTTFIFISLFGLVPIRLININNFDLFNIITLIIYFVYIFYGFYISFIEKNYYSRASQCVFLLILAITISYVHMIYSLNKYTSWLALYSLNYIIFWVMLKEIKSYKDIDIFLKRMKIFCFLAIGVLFFLFLNPTLLSGPLSDAGMGSLQSEEFGIPRIFTPGMTYLSLGIIFALCYIFYNDVKKNKVTYIIYLALSLLAIVIITSVRTFLITIALSFCILIILNLNIIKTTVVGLILLVGTTLIFMLPSDSQYYFLYERMASVFNIQSFDFGVITSGEILTGRSYYSTIYWRIQEAEKALTFIDTPSKAILGNMGEYYQFEIEDILAGAAYWLHRHILRFRVGRGHSIFSIYFILHHKNF